MSPRMHIFLIILWYGLLVMRHQAAYRQELHNTSNIVDASELQLLKSALINRTSPVYLGVFLGLLISLVINALGY